MRERVQNRVSPADPVCAKKSATGLYFSKGRRWRTGRESKCRADLIDLVARILVAMLQAIGGKVDDRDAVQISPNRTSRSFGSTSAVPVAPSCGSLPDAPLHPAQSAFMIK
jgi:hypothetical protein